LSKIFSLAVLSPRPVGVKVRFREHSSPGVITGGQVEDCMAKSPELGPTNSIPSSVIGSAGEPLRSFRWTWTGALVAPVTPNTVLGKDMGSGPKWSALITGVGVGMGVSVGVGMGMGVGGMGVGVGGTGVGVGVGVVEGFGVGLGVGVGVGEGVGVGVPL
jgi:hypothetical protein